MHTYDPQTLLLLYFVLPIWLVAGFADWICHRATNIQETLIAILLLEVLLYFEEYLSNKRARRKA